MKSRKWARRRRALSIRSNQRKVNKLKGFAKLMGQSLIDMAHDYFGYANKAYSNIPKEPGARLTVKALEDAIRLSERKDAGVTLETRWKWVLPDCAGVKFVAEQVSAAEYRYTYFDPLFSVNPFPSCCIYRNLGS